jgi:glucose/arabinose dehydrogenase
MITQSVGYGDPPQANQQSDPAHAAAGSDEPRRQTLRLKDDGTVPPDNPFAARRSGNGSTTGHRNILGLAVPRYARSLSVE